jgi:hypothetical protein
VQVTPSGQLQADPLFLLLINLKRIPPYISFLPKLANPDRKFIYAFLQKFI